MALDLQRAANRRMRVVVFGLAGAVVLLVGVLVGVLVSGGDDGDEAAPTAPSTAEASDTDLEGPGFDPEETLQPSGDFVAPSDYVRLPDGAREEEGLPVGFPQSPDGAVAAVAASTRNAWSWDADQIERGIRVYASADTGADLAGMAEAGAEGIRRYIGVSETGPVPQDAALNAWPIGVQWEELDDGAVRVFTLTRIAFTPGGGVQTRTHLHSTVNDAVWEDGDWKVRAVPAEVTRDGPATAEVGSQKFIDEGWVAIQEGDRR